LVGLRLLVVDDDESTRFIVRRALAGLGWKGALLEAASGEEALALLAREQVDAILTDYRMGGATGVDVLAYAVARQPHARRILMSGTLEEVILRSLGARANPDFCFEKPATREAWERLLGLALEPELAAARE
jgi:CheY-like chemotaxis protein